MASCLTQNPLDDQTFSISLISTFLGVAPSSLVLSLLFTFSPAPSLTERHLTSPNASSLIYVAFHIPAES